MLACRLSPVRGPSQEATVRQAPSCRATWDRSDPDSPPKPAVQQPVWDCTQPGSPSRKSRASRASRASAGEARSPSRRYGCHPMVMWLGLVAALGLCSASVGPHTAWQPLQEAQSVEDQRRRGSLTLTQVRMSSHGDVALSCCCIGALFSQCGTARNLAAPPGSPGRQGPAQTRLAHPHAGAHVTPW